MYLQNISSINSLIIELRKEQDRLREVQKGSNSVQDFAAVVRIDIRIDLIEEIVSHLQENKFKY